MDKEGGGGGVCASRPEGGGQQNRAKGAPARVQNNSPTPTEDVSFVGTQQKLTHSAQKRLHPQ